MKNLRWKIITVVAVFVVFFAVGLYPILAAKYKLPAPGWLMAKQLKLGLDLRGGVHLVLRVHTDEALQISSTTTAEQLREALRTAGVTPSGISVPSPTVIRVEGVAQDRDAEFRRVADDLLSANYDRSSGTGNSYTFTMKPNIERDMREQTVVQAQETIDRRVNELGVSEPNISRYGNEGNQILVQLPGVTDVNRAK
jgi:preprotein translocase subunit SecD